MQSKTMRKKDAEYGYKGGVREYCLDLYRHGNSYADIAGLLNMNPRTLGHYLNRWRREAGLPIRRSKPRKERTVTLRGLRKETPITL